jgi:hypothetical protein
VIQGSYAEELLCEDCYDSDCWEIGGFCHTILRKGELESFGITNVRDGTPPRRCQ